MATISGIGPAQATTPDGGRGLVPPSFPHPGDLAGATVAPRPEPGPLPEPPSLTPADEFRDLLASAFECFPMGAFIMGLDGRFLHVNPFLCRLLGRSTEELRSHRITDFVTPDERLSMREIASLILDGGLENYIEQRVFVRADGSRVRLDITGAVLRTSNGRPRAILALARQDGNLPEPRSTPDPLAFLERLAATGGGADGKAMREEFDSFCGTISQEFRVPVRIIEGYADIVVEEYRSGLDDVALRYLHTIREQSRRLSALIDNTLALSKIISHPLSREHVDLSAMALDTAAVVRAETHAHDVDIRIEPRLYGKADSPLVARLLKNLFENAFRFARSSESPTVEFGRTDDTDTPTFFVRDNGSGFDMASSYKLFLPFETLHEGSEAAGAGVGLAEVKRIVSHHGGRVWAEGSPGAGATFYFTLSAAEASSSLPSNV